MINGADFLKQVITGLPAGIFVLHGEEEYAKQKALDLACQQADAHGLGLLNTHIFEGVDDVSVVSSACEQLPMMADMRLVVAKDPPVFLQKNRAAAIRDAWAKLPANFPDTTCLLVYLHGALAVPLTGSWKNLASSLVEFKPLSLSAASKELIRLATAQQITLSSAAAGHLYDCCAGDMVASVNLLEQLCSVQSPGDSLSIQQIDSHNVSTPEVSVFQMIDQLLTGSVSKALAQYRQTSGGWQQQSGGLLSLIERQLNALYHAPAAVSLVGQAQAAAALGVRDFVLDRIIRQRSMPLSRPQLRDLIVLCADMDYHIKQGFISDTAAMDQIVFRIVALRKDA